MALLSILGGIASGLGSLFGGGDEEEQSFSRDSTVTNNATKTDLSPELLKALEGLFGKVIDSGRFEQSGAAQGSRLAQLSARAAEGPTFDVDSFVKGITQQATANAGLDMESSINELASKSGGSIEGNSMNRLLANRIRNQTAANLAGIASQAASTGEQIRLAGEHELTTGIEGLSTGLSDQLLKLINVTRGATQSASGKTTEKTSGTGSSEKDKGIGGIFDGISSIFGAFGDARKAA